MSHQCPTYKYYCNLDNFEFWRRYFLAIIIYYYCRGCDTPLFWSDLWLWPWTQLSLRKYYSNHKYIMYDNVINRVNRNNLYWELWIQNYNFIHYYISIWPPQPKVVVTTLECLHYFVFSAPKGVTHCQITFTFYYLLCPILHTLQ